MVMGKLRVGDVADRKASEQERLCSLWMLGTGVSYLSLLLHVCVCFS